MKKTNFDRDLEIQLKDPEFEARFRRANEIWNSALKTKTTGKNRILESVHETARDLYSGGFISLRRIRRFDALLANDKPLPKKRRDHSLRACDRNKG